MVVVDNASTDVSLKGVKNIRIPIVILNNSENRGFGTACNQGASGSDADYLLFLNPDTQVFEDSLIKPLPFLQESNNQRIGILGLQLLDGKDQIMRTCSTFPSAREFVSTIFGLNHIFPRLFKNHLMLDWDHRQNREVDHVMGSFFLVRNICSKNYRVLMKDILFTWRTLIFLYALNKLDL